MFSAYSEEEIYKILEARVGNTVVAPNLLTFVSKKIGTSNGDVRKAFELTAESIQIRMTEVEGMSPEKIRELDSSDGPLVAIKYGAQANKLAEVDFKNRIDGLPLSGKMILCVMTTLSHASITKTTLGQMKDYVTDCLRSRGSEDEMLALEDFTTLLSTLVDNGLLRASSNAGHEDIFDPTRMLSDLYREPLYLGSQQEDIEKILDKELDHSFFHNLRERAMANKHLFQS